MKGGEKKFYAQERTRLLQSEKSQVLYIPVGTASNILKQKMHVFKVKGSQAEMQATSPGWGNAHLFFQYYFF